MSGSVGLLALAEYFAAHPHKRTLRFIWCGSEERGLLGAKAYCAAHEEELSKTVLCINLDMIGCTMGHLIACCTTEEALVSYISYLGRELGTLIDPYQDVYSSDSTPFADKGIPAISLARIAPPPAGTIHNRYDTAQLVSAQQMAADIGFICQNHGGGDRVYGDAGAFVVIADGGYDGCHIGGVAVHIVKNAPGHDCAGLGMILPVHQIADIVEIAGDLHQLHLVLGSAQGLKNISGSLRHLGHMGETVLRIAQGRQRPVRHRDIGANLCILL
jgi:hypothetical protein